MSSSSSSSTTSSKEPVVVASATTLVCVATAVASSALTLLIQRLWKNQRDRQQQYIMSNRLPPKRVGGAIKLKPEQYYMYTQLHDYVWEKVLKRLKQSNIRNYVIYYHKPTSILFSHFEWIGSWKYPHLSNKQLEHQFNKDMKDISNDPITREWWTYCEPCQEPFEDNWPKGLVPPSQQDPLNPPVESANAEWWTPLICVGYNGHWPIEYSSELRDPNFLPQNPFGQTSTRTNPPSSSDTTSNSTSLTARTPSKLVDQAFDEVDQ